MMKPLLAAALVAALLTSTSCADDKMDQHEAYSYTMGIRLAELLKAQGIKNLDVDAFAEAIEDMQEGEEPKLTQEQMSAAILAQKEKDEAEANKNANANTKSGAEFLAVNAKKEGVLTLPSGLQYKVIEKGEGASPKSDSKVKVHYRGTLIDGTEFDSSYARNQPAVFPLGGVIPGFSEALSIMKTGSKWEVYIPGDLAYGNRAVGKHIGPNETLIFELHLLEIY